MHVGKREADWGCLRVGCNRLRSDDGGLLMYKGTCDYWHRCPRSIINMSIHLLLHLSPVPTQMWVLLRLFDGCWGKCRRDVIIARLCRRFCIESKSWEIMRLRNPDMLLDWNRNLWRGSDVFRFEGFRGRRRWGSGGGGLLIVLRLHHRLFPFSLLTARFQIQNVDYTVAILRTISMKHSIDKRRITLPISDRCRASSCSLTL